MDTTGILRILTIIFAFAVIVVCAMRMANNKKKMLVLIPPIILMVHNLAYLFSIQFNIIPSAIGDTWAYFIRLHAIITWLIIEWYKYWNDKNIKGGLL